MNRFSHSYRLYSGVRCNLSDFKHHVLLRGRREAKREMMQMTGLIAECQTGRLIPRNFMSRVWCNGVRPAGVRAERERGRERELELENFNTKG